MPTVVTEVKLAGYPCTVPRPDLWPGVERCNSYYCPLGPASGRAYVLMERRHLNQINFNAAVSLTLNAVTFPRLYLVKATKVVPSTTGSLGGLYQVELADSRWILERFTACNVQINCRLAMPESSDPLEKYFKESLVSETTEYTWTTALTKIWDEMSGLSALTGAIPSLPSTPAGVPVNWRFTGCSAWAAFHEAIHELGWTTRYDPISDAYSIKKVGDTQSGLAAAEASHTYWTSELDAAECNPTRFPENVMVYFRRRDHHYPTTNKTQERTGNWSDAPAYVETVATGKANAIAGSKMVMWSQLLATYDASAALENSSTLRTAAELLVTDWVAAQTARAGKTYIGCHADLLPGSQVKAVTWHNYGDGSGTTVLKYAGVPGYEVYAVSHAAAMDWIGQAGWRENVRPLDLGPAHVIGKLDGTLAQGGTVTVSIWSGAGGSEADTGVNVVCRDWLMKSGASAIASGKRCVVTWINSVPYVTAVECA